LLLPYSYGGHGRIRAALETSDGILDISHDIYGPDASFMDLEYRVLSLHERQVVQLLAREADRTRSGEERRGKAKRSDKCRSIGATDDVILWLVVSAVGHTSKGRSNTNSTTTSLSAGRLLCSRQMLSTACTCT
jgi:hypothetical protein